MTQQTINVQSSSSAVRDVIQSLPQELASSRNLVVQKVLERIGIAILGKIEESFKVKSAGGTDEAGDRWAPLKLATIAYGRAKRNKRESARDTRPSQGLTKKQQTRWWDLYKQGLAIFKGDKASAAKRAWSIIKRQGARTLLDKYGNQRVLILQDSGRLLQSLTPNSGSADQILKVDRGSVTVGTKRPGAMAHHYGSPPRGLPQRKLWPDTQDWPASWWKDITKEVQQGLVEILVDTLKRSS